MNEKSYLLEFFYDGEWHINHHYVGVANNRDARTRALFALKFWKRLIRTGQAKRATNARLRLYPHQQISKP